MGRRRTRIRWGGHIQDPGQESKINLSSDPGSRSDVFHGCRPPGAAGGYRSTLLGSAIVRMGVGIEWVVGAVSLGLGRRLLDRRNGLGLEGS